LVTFCKFVLIEVLRLLCYSFVHWHLQYYAISWGISKNSVLQPLSVLQNNTSRVMTFTKYRCHILSPIFGKGHYLSYTVTPLYKNVEKLWNIET